MSLFFNAYLDFLVTAHQMIWLTSESISSLRAFFVVERIDFEIDFWRSKVTAASYLINQYLKHVLRDFIQLKFAVY